MGDLLFFPGVTTDTMVGGAGRDALEAAALVPLKDAIIIGTMPDGSLYTDVPDAYEFEDILAMLHKTGMFWAEFFEVPARVVTSDYDDDMA